MDGVLFNIEEPLRMAGVDIFAEMGVGVTVEDFVSFMGTANYLGGVANVKGVKGYGPDRGGKEKYAKPNPGIGFPGALELITQYQWRLIVADTNNSLIRYLDLNMEQAELQTSELKGVQPPASKSESSKRLRNQSSADKRQLKLMVVHPVRATCVSKYHYLKTTISQRLAIVSKMRSAYINHLSEIPFQLRSFRLCWSSQSEITLAYLVKPKSSPNNLQQPVTS
ncbi:hypothetical protein NC651_012296 [Populus alba x Populus x berolinensis]|nr:hypothetical protein NC651_012296 [Populus alba x Populus x berolinensis]